MLTIKRLLLYISPALFLLMQLLIFITYGCKEDLLVVKMPEDPKPPTQSKTWDFVGLSGEHNITSIIVIPDQPWVIYVGVMSNFSDRTMGRVLKTVDWGRTWNAVADSVSVSALVYDPGNHNIIYAGLNVNNGSIPGVIKSDNAGMTWTRSDSGLYFDQETWVDVIATDPLNGRIVYAGITGFFGGGLARSTDAGRSWAYLPTRSPGGPRILGTGVTALAIDPKNTNEIYAGVAWTGGLYKSYDGGMTFATLRDTGESIPVALVVNPFRTNTVYIDYLGVNFHRSTDHGETWTGNPTHSIDANRIIVYRDSTLYTAGYFGDGGGVYCSTDDGTSWRTIGLVVDSLSVPIMAMDIDKNNGFIYVANGKYSSAGIYRYRILGSF
jgi:photosystem II stability/assembly factor-like uncharacterized protein